MSRDPQMMVAYQAYWSGLTKQGDPIHVLNPFLRSFEAGWNAAFQYMRCNAEFGLHSCRELKGHDGSHNDQGVRWPAI